METEQAASVAADVEASVTVHGEGEQQPCCDEHAAETPQQPLTLKQFKQLLAKYFTVRRARLEECGHKYVHTNPPRNNCEYCWFVFFNQHGEMVQQLNDAFQEGKKFNPAHPEVFIVNTMGIKFAKNFLKFMSTLANLQKAQMEAAKQEAVKDSGDEIAQIVADATV